MKQLLKRLSLPAPAFFVKVRNLGGALSGIGIGLMAMDFQGSKLLDLIKPFAIELVVAGAVMALVAQFTVKPEVPNKEL